MTLQQIKCDFCNDITCGCSDCNHIKGTLCSKCYNKLSDEHMKYLPNAKEQKEKRYGVREAPMPLSRFKDSE